MPTYTVAQAFPTGATSNWTSPTTGETVVFHKHSVQFVELPGQSFEIGRTQKQGPVAPGQQITGNITPGQNGRSYFKEERQQRQGFGGGRPGGGGGNQRFGGGGAGKEIMAQVALKAAVEMAIASQKFDPLTVDSLAAAYMETLLKTSGLRVEAPAPQQPAQPPVAQPMAQPQNGYAYQAPPQQFAPQQQQYAQQPAYQQQQPQYSTDDVPF